MSSFKRSGSSVRSILLFAAVLAVVGVIFAVVQYVGPGAGESSKTASSRTEVAPLPKPSPGRPTTSPTLPIQEGMPELRGGRRTSLRIYSPDSNVARMELGFDEWKPTGARKDEFAVVNPEIRVRTPGGQELRLVSQRGTIVIRKSKGGAYDLRWGRLEGDVVLELDRLSTRQRSALPPDQRDASPTPERLVRAELDDVEFDLEAARISTQGRFAAQAVEGSIAGIGLTVRYDELNSRIDAAEISRDVQIVLKRAGRNLQIHLPGSADVVPGPRGAEPIAEEPASPPPAAPAEPEAPLASEDEEIPLLVPDEPRQPTRRPIETYEARFTGSVAVEETAPDGAVSRLEAETLQFLFDFGQRQRETAGTVVSEDQESDAESPAEEVMASEVVLTCSGGLSIDLLENQKSEPPGDRLHVVATGQPVYLRDRQGSAACNELEFHNETQRVWLRSHGGDDVTAASDDSGRMTGREIYFDRQGGELLVTGPGELSDARARAVSLAGSEETAASPTPEGQTTHIRFRENLAARLETVVLEDPDEVTGQTRTVKREYLRSARFVGDVKMAQPDGSIEAREVNMTFAVPTGPRSASERIERMTAAGSVCLTHGPDRIRCETIDVEMDADERGRISPRHARAEGNVVASQGERMIAARDGMLVDLRLYEERDSEPGTVSSNAGDRRDKTSIHFEPGLRRLQAFGQVVVRDPEQALNVAAEFLDCTFDEGRRIDKATVAGDEAGSSATVDMRDSSIQGRLIDLDVAEQHADVPGAGRLTFMSERDLDGRELDNPVPIAVSWADRMFYRGGENRARFVGTVHAASEGTTLDCQELAVSFEEEQTPPERQDEGDWWIFKPFARGDEEPSQTEHLGGPRFRKTAVLFSATGHAVVLSANTDEATNRLESRVRLAADQIDLDLKRKQVTIDSAGKLLIEDYRIRESAARAAGQPRDPFGAIGGDEPSQTFIEWAGSMAYNFRYHTANFDEETLLRHRSGSRILMGAEVAPDATSDAEGDGRDARLTCRSLFVQFTREPNQQRPRGAAPILLGGSESSGRGSEGLGSLSGFALDKFQSEGEVYFEDSGVSVTADRVTYTSEHALLTIFGSASQPARVYDEREGFRSISGPVIYWNRANNRIEAPDSTIFSQ